MLLIPFLSTVVLGVAAISHNQGSVLKRATNASTSSGAIPSQAVVIPPNSFSVLGPTGPFRNSSFTELFNPTSSTPPFFQIFDPAFLPILGPNASFHTISTQPANASVLFFAHEAPVYLSDTDELFFVGLDLKKDTVAKLSMKAVEDALKAAGGQDVDVPITPITLPSTIQHINGGTGPLGSSLVVVTDGFGPLPPSVALVNPQPPFNATVLLDNFYGRQFNSMNDVKIHPISKAIFFTDVSIGNEITIRPAPQIPNQVYRLDPHTGAVRVVATDFVLCNGIAFSADGASAFVTDSGAVTSITTNDQTKPATIYKFDVDPTSQAFTNRRIFAYSDTGVPDGLMLDAAGNVYSGCGDGVHVWSPDGTLLGKFFTGDVVANMQFAGDGRLVLLGGTKIYLARLANGVRAGRVAFPSS